MLRMTNFGLSSILLLSKLMLSHHLSILRLDLHLNLYGAFHPSLPAEILTPLLLAGRYLLSIHSHFKIADLRIQI